MYLNRLKLSLLFLLSTFCVVNESTAQVEKEHIEVALRMIGHKLLLDSGDSTSLVLPIESEGEKFRIRFESAFPFAPDRLISSVDSIFKVAKLGDRYRLEVENTDRKEIVYSYEVAPADSGFMPCRTRDQPKANYNVLISLLDKNGQSILLEDEPEENITKASVNEKLLSSKGIVTILIVLAVLFVVGIYFLRSKKRKSLHSNYIKIGQYQFDQRNMKLRLKNESIDLTSKETDLLSLLHSSMNETLEREEILKVVWGDEGDYIGRTLDVFISKLRKKFSGDANVKIVNVRGVGYKLMLSQAE